jgi:tryptophan synthase beta chain
MMSNLLYDDDGQIEEAHSVSAGLDYPGGGAEHSHLNEIGRAQYVSITDEQAMEGFKLLSRAEGIIPALESAHAIAYVTKLAPEMKKDEIIVICLSGRGDKDVNQVAEIMGVPL